MRCAKCSGWGLLEFDDEFVTFSCTRCGFSKSLSNDNPHARIFRDIYKKRVNGIA